MPFPVRPEWSTASVGACDDPTDAVDHSAPSAIRPESTYISGKVVQTNGATSFGCHVLSTPTATYICTALTGRVTSNKIRPAGASYAPPCISKISPIKSQKPQSQDIIFGRSMAQNIVVGP